jgi:hypothetical protein
MKLNFAESIFENFESNINSVKQLLTFDKVILGIAINKLQNVYEKQTEKGIADSHAYSVKNALDALQTIHSHNSTRHSYKTINQQCIVLFVSHFATAISDLFKTGINYSIACGLTTHFKNEEVKLSVNDLINCDFNLQDSFGSIIANKEDASFQDMKSIGRIFGKYFDTVMEKNECVNNIIVSQAARNSIVHASGKADDRFQKQIKDANPRSFLTTIDPENTFQVNAEDFAILEKSMISYFDKIKQQIYEFFAKHPE